MSKKSKSNIFDKCFIKKLVFKPGSLGGEEEITIRQLTVGEVLEYQSMLRDDKKSQTEAMFYAVKCAIVEPALPEKSYEELNAIGNSLFLEVFSKMQTIGMTEQEEKQHFKNLEELAKKISDENSSEVTVQAEEELEKK